MHASQQQGTGCSSSQTAQRLSLRSESLLDSDQQAAITRLVERNHTLLIAGMGSGKTVIALNAIDELFYAGALARVLVVAPSRVVDLVWRTEASHWEHLQDLHATVGVATGTPKQRRAVFDNASNKVVVLGVDNVPWMVKSGLYKTFDGLVVDESTRLKSAGSVATKALRRAVKHFTWTVCMSGTPVVEGIDGLYAQMLIVDGGRTLGRSKQAYLDRYFYPTDFNRYNWAPKAGAAAEIAKKIAPYVHEMPPYPLPSLDVNTLSVAMPEVARDVYASMANDFVLSETITAANSAVLLGKLQQIASGFIYTDDGKTKLIHDEKRTEMARWLSTRIARKEHGLVVYLWDEQVEWLRDCGVPCLTDDAAALAEQWNAGTLPFLGLHPRSAGHGLNLQHGGSMMLWLSPPWSLDQYQQTIARICRRGQDAGAVHVDILASLDTVDEVVMHRLQGKKDASDEFIKHLRNAAARGTR
jgi:hypothetical protein